MSFLEKKKIIIIRKYIDNLQLRNEVKYRLKKKQKKKSERQEKEIAMRFDRYERP